MSVAAKEKLSYVMEHSDKYVIVTSDFYIPFEPKKANIRIRDKVIALHSAIKNAIKNLVVGENEILFASYSENDKNRFYDVENMLFFNIGASAFRECCKSQLAFMGDETRFYSDEEEKTDGEEKYYYSYLVKKEREVEAILASKKVIASWDDIFVDMKIPQSATRYYKTLRENSSQISVNSVLNGKELFGMKLDITLPNNSLPASVMKPLLDGIICAFHGEEDRAEGSIIKMFGMATDVINADTAKLNIFGEREYLSPYRGENSYKWNPEDERLQFAWITIHKGSKAKLSGKIYSWN